MSGHNKWSKIKHKKAASDAKKSKVFTKLVRFITVEAKKAGGNLQSPGLALAIVKAKEVNMPADTIDRAIKKASTDPASMEAITYEAYGPGGVAMIIEALTDNRNKAAQEVRLILSRHGSALAGVGAASWAFEKTAEGWNPQTTVDLSDDDLNKLEALVDELEDNDEVQNVYTNAN
jgi:YebC/PmpR family DNA-binding regulatory protein